MKRSAVIGFAVGLAAGMPLTAPAQDRTATLVGSVRDVDDRPLEDATIEVMGTGARSVTREGGRYRVTGIPPGQRWILVRRDGYAPTRASLTLEEDGRRELRFELKPLPRGSSEDAVLADLGMNRARWQDFVQRSQSAFGTFLTRDELAHSSDDLIDLVRRYLPGRSRLALERRSTDAGVGPGRLLRRTNRSLALANRPYEGGGCTPAISLNGSPPSLGATLADFERDQVEALEIYRRGSWSPTEFAYRDRAAGCGLIVVWLR
jgi:hypothetical protein